MFLRSDGGYEPETNLDPSKFGEVEIIKRSDE